MAYDDQRDPLYDPATKAQRQPKAHAPDPRLEDRLRISAILESPEGKGNPELAAKLALRSGMDATEAIDILRSAPAVQATGPSPYERALLAEGASGLRMGGGGPASALGGDPRAARLAQISKGVKSYNASAGYGARTDRG